MGCHPQGIERSCESDILIKNKYNFKKSLIIHKPS